jgi:RNA 3'-phosphate cyclase
MMADTRLRPLAIDGAHGEGGGQLLRTAVALAAITGRAIRVENIRARRSKPGLAAQHAAAVAAVGALCDATVEGLARGSTALSFAPGRLHGGEFRFDVGTAGSVTLVLQALLPAIVAGGARTIVTVRGGTDVRAAPPLDYFRMVTLPLLARCGVAVELTVRRRGYYPRGGGEIAVAVGPSPLRPLHLGERGAVRGIHGVAHVAAIAPDVARRMREALLARLAAVPGIAPRVEVVTLCPAEAIGAGGAVVAWIDAAHTTLGAGRVAERGVRAETLGSAVGAELAADLASGATVDVHAVDQLLVWLALAGGGSFTVRELSPHAQTAIWLIEQFLPVRFACNAEGALVRVRADPCTEPSR